MSEIDEVLQLYKRVKEGVKRNLKQYLEGVFIRDPGFLSTSRDKEVGKSFVAIGGHDDKKAIDLLCGVLMEIEISPEATGYDISMHSEFPDEYEVLLQSGTCLVDVDVYDVGYDVGGFNEPVGCMVLCIKAKAVGTRPR